MLVGTQKYVKYHYYLLITLQNSNLHAPYGVPAHHARTHRTAGQTEGFGQVIRKRILSRAQQRLLTSVIQQRFSRQYPRFQNTKSWLKRTEVETVTTSWSVKVHARLRVRIPSVLADTEWDCRIQPQPPPRARNDRGACSTPSVSSRDGIFYLMLTHAYMMVPHIQDVQNAKGLCAPSREREHEVQHAAQLAHRWR